MNIKKKQIISYQGIEGSNSHLACQKLFPNAHKQSCETFEEVFDSTEKRRSDIALIPIENSIAGRVAEIHSLMHKTSLKIVGEHFMQVELHLLGLKNTNIKNIKSVHSHIHALSQCRNIIKKLNLQRIITADTAGAAKEISLKGNLTQTVIASELASRIYKLKILRKNIEDKEKNTTRFILLQKKRIDINSSKGKVLTSAIFRVNNIPASLHKALGCFAINSVNMLKLESYYVGDSFKQAEFYVDFEGHEKDHDVANALQEMNEYTDFIKILGVYYADKFRK